MAAKETRETDAWMASKPGETITGKVLEVGEAWSNAGAGSFYPLITIEDASGVVWKIHGFRTVLKSLILSKEPLPGETITVTYDGPRARKASDGGNNPPVIYRLTVEGPGRDAKGEARRVYGKLSSGRVAMAPDAQTTMAEADDSDIPF